MISQAFLAKRNQGLEALRCVVETSAPSRCSVGIAALDSLLPGGGVRVGSLVEWLSLGVGGGAVALGLKAALRACSPTRPLVVVDVSGCFYAGALESSVAGTCLLVRPATVSDGLWALEQALRCRTVGAVLGWVQGLSDRAGRRLQLAAEQGSHLGMLIRSACEERAPCWADARFRVEPLATGGARRFRVSLVRCRGGLAGVGRSIDLEIDDETGGLHLASKLVSSAPVCRAAGA